VPELGIKRRNPNGDGGLDARDPAKMLNRRLRQIAVMLLDRLQDRKRDKVLLFS